jgi:hypothetical protein
MTVNERLAFLLDQPLKKRRKYLGRLSLPEREELETHWQLWARPAQVAPETDWRVWLIMAGRGFGKTRAGSEWVRAVAAADPVARIALVGASLSEARAVMVEGDSGLLAVSPPKRRPAYEPSLRRLTWPNGAVATLYSAGEPESLRGPQHSHARRTGAKGSLSQRGPCAHRCACPLRDRRHRLGTPGDSGQWRGMACRRSPDRGMGR